MFPCMNPPSEDQRISQSIDKELKRDYREYAEKIKLLLLGTGESGKTTIIKQMQILHINGFSESEKVAKIPYIKQNIHESIYSIVSSMGRIDPPLKIADEKGKSAEYILNIGPIEPEIFTDEYYDHVKVLWANETVQEAFKRSNEFQLIDSAQHFLDKIDVIRQPDYIPEVQDILFCRIETVAISKIEFSVQVPKRFGGGKAHFAMFDVGGQRGHRKKWISVFEGIQAILFLIASSDFDQTLREDETKNRLEEAFDIFSQIWWSRYVRTAGKIVFLNKQDVLKKKIENGKKLEKYFPEFANYKIPGNTGNANREYDRAKFFIRDKVVSLTKQIPAGQQQDVRYILPGLAGKVADDDRQAYVHFTTATDTNNVKLVFHDVHDLIIEMNTKNIYE